MEYMNININKKHKRKYGLVALLVDRDDFLNDLKMIRDKIGITEMPYKFPDLKNEELNNIVKYYNENRFTVFEVFLALKEFCHDQHIFLSDVDKKFSLACIWAEQLAYKYRNSSLYIPVILAAILVGNIESTDLRSTYIESIDKKRILELQEELRDDERLITIKVTRESTQQEVKEAFNFIKKYFFGIKKDGSDATYELYKDQVYITELLDTKSEIKTHREWYLLYKSGKKISEICGSYIREKTGEVFDEKTIDSAINKYTKLLNTPL